MSTTEIPPQAPGDPNHQPSGDNPAGVPAGVPPTAAYSPPVGDIPGANFQRVTPDAPLYPPAPVVSPAPANKPVSTARKWIATGVAGAIAIGVMVYGAYKWGSSQGDDKVGASPVPATDGTLGVGSQSSSINPETGTATLTPSSEATPTPETLVTVGNINPNSLQNISPNSNSDTFEVFWGTSGTVHSQKLAGPGNHTPTEQGSSALSMFSEMMSANLGYSLQLPIYFTNNAEFANIVTRFNNQFLANHSTIPNVQLVFFDEAGNRAQFEQAAPDPDGDLTIQKTATSGPIYMQAISSSEWADPTQFDPKKAIELGSVGINYVTRTNGDPNATHMFVTRVSFKDENGDIVDWNQIASLPVSAGS